MLILWNTNYILTAPFDFLGQVLFFFFPQMKIVQGKSLNFCFAAYCCAASGKSLNLNLSLSFPIKGDKIKLTLQKCGKASRWCMEISQYVLMRSRRLLAVVMINLVPAWSCGRTEAECNYPCWNQARIPESCKTCSWMFNQDM